MCVFTLGMRSSAAVPCRYPSVFVSSKFPRRSKNRSAVSLSGDSPLIPMITDPALPMGKAAALPCA